MALPQSNNADPAPALSFLLIPAPRLHRRYNRPLICLSGVALSYGSIKTIPRTSDMSPRCLSTSPIDFLIIATHCGDSSGYRWTHEFTDLEGLNCTVVTDIAVGFARTDDPEILKVAHFFRFISVDGVDWTDRVAKSKLYVGNVMHDFNERLNEGPRKFNPTKKETVDRVVGFSAMMMSDSNLLFAQHTMANMGTPIVINNACLSWHRLAANMMYAGARAYVGTLFPILSAEAAEVVTKMLDAYWGKLLAVAVWSAQRDVYRSDLRRPYVVAGVFSQYLRIDPIDYPERIKRRLAETLAGYKDMLASIEASGDAKRIAAVKDVIKIYEREYEHFANLRLMTGCARGLLNSPAHTPTASAMSSSAWALVPWPLRGRVARQDGIAVWALPLDLANAAQRVDIAATVDQRLIRSDPVRLLSRLRCLRLRGATGVS